MQNTLPALTYPFRHPYCTTYDDTSITRALANEAEEGDGTKWWDKDGDGKDVANRRDGDDVVRFLCKNVGCDDVEQLELLS